MGAAPRSASEHPATWKHDYPVFHPDSRGAWRGWLTANHGSERGVWAVNWRSTSTRDAVPYAHMVEEAICFGWIDSTVNVFDDERGMQLFTPRRPRSTWTRLNRARVTRMEEQGLMTDAGRRAVEIAKGNGWWTIYDPVEDLLEPGELAAALDGNPMARRHWDEFPASAKKAMLWWVVSAVRPETQARRIATIVAEAAEGRRALG